MMSYFIAHLLDSDDFNVDFDFTSMERPDYPADGELLVELSLRELLH